MFSDESSSSYITPKFRQTASKIFKYLTGNIFKSNTKSLAENQQNLNLAERQLDFEDFSNEYSNLTMMYSEYDKLIAQSTKFFEKEFFTVINESDDIDLLEDSLEYLEKRSYLTRLTYNYAIDIKDKL